MATTQAPYPQALSLEQRLAAHCRTYRGARLGPALFQLANTLLPFLLLWASMIAAMEEAPWLVPVLAIPATGFFIRLFIIQHDCGHNSFLPSRAANRWLGRAISLVTWMPFAFWRREHALHHATSADLARRQIFEIRLYTTDEFRALSPPRRLLYRVYRHPLFLTLVAGPVYVLLRNRLPLDTPLGWRDLLTSVMPHNLGLAGLYGGLIALLGAVPVVTATLSCVLPASALGIWLFFVQHHFEDASWYEQAEWNANAAALHGSSYYDLPPLLHWFTGHIGLHHIHHLCPGIPNYRLQACLRASPELQSTNRFTLRDSLKCGRLALWDGRRRRLISFAEFDNAEAVPAA